MKKNSVLKWLVAGFLGGFLLAGCTCGKLLQYKPGEIQPDPPPQHIPSLWCELAEKGIIGPPCMPPKEA
jgi:hypothetical protein